MGTTCLSQRASARECVHSALGTTCLCQYVVNMFLSICRLATTSSKFNGNDTFYLFILSFPLRWAALVPTMCADVYPKAALLQMLPPRLRLIFLLLHVYYHYHYHYLWLTPPILLLLLLLLVILSRLCYSTGTTPTTTTALTATQQQKQQLL